MSADAGDRVPTRESLTEATGATRNGVLSSPAREAGLPGTAAVDRLRVVIADPDRLARRSICGSLQQDGGFDVCAEAKDGLEAIDLAAHHRPDLLVMEIALPVVGGISVCREITTRVPDVRIVMFSIAQDHEVQVRALRAGAVGFLSKDMPIESILRALRAVAGGEVAVTRALTAYVVRLLRATPEHGIGVRPVRSPLTTREWEILDLICAGNSTRQISATLFLSEDTVYSHTKNILRKLGVHSRSDAIAMAAQLRQPRPEQPATRAAHAVTSC
jgi:two-component system, NarL family, response regulator LiaR